MKQLLILLAIFTSITLTAQEGTTLEEYRYLSKGYVYQLEMGLDAQKEGYLVKNLFQASNEADLVGLYQIGNAEPRALLVVLDKGKDKATYMCIPNSTADQRVKDLAIADQRNITTMLKNDYQLALNEFLFSALSNPSLKTLSYHSPQTTPAVYQKDETLVSRSADLEQYIQETPRIEKIERAEKKENTKLSKRTLIGDISDRNIIQSDPAKANSRSKGVIAIKVCVDSNGNVTTAKFTQRGSTTFDSYLKKVALKAAKSIKFAKSDIAEQCGIVNYKF